VVLLKEDRMPKLMIKPWILLVPLALLLSAAVACGSDEAKEKVSGEAATAVVGQMVETDAGFYVNVTPQELWSMLGDKDFTLVNVYAGYEGEIEGTDLFISYDSPDEFPGERDSKIVVYCRSGNSSASAATTLVSLGYTDVWNLDGGMIAWAEAGYPLVNERQ
jgi:rhodanese-related sulfurtransferase